MISPKLSSKRTSPQFVIAIFTLLMISASIFLVTNEYAKKSEKLFYENMFDKLTTINEIKKHKLEIYLRYRKADVQALSTIQTIGYLVKELVIIDELYALNGTSKEEYKRLLRSLQKYGGYLQNYIKEYNYEDILLLDVKDGHIIYSVNDEDYVGLDLTSFQYAQSEIAKLYRRVLEDKGTHFSDMHRPILQKEEPVMLVATPVYIDGSMSAVVMLKLSSTVINEVMHFQLSSKKSLESYAVGSDGLLRSDSLLEPALSVKNLFTMPKQQIFLDTLAYSEAIKGQRGAKIIKDYRGVDVLSAFTPFSFDGINWAIITEIDEAEIVAEFKSIRYEIVTVSLIISLFLALAGYFGIGYIIRTYVVEPMREISDIALGFEEIIDKSVNEIYIFEKKSLYFTYANKSALENIGYSMEVLCNMRPFELKPLVNKEDFRRIIEPLIRHEKRFVRFQTIHQRGDGTRYDVSVNLQLLEIDKDEKFVAFVEDITNEKRAQQEREYYYELSSHDHLTKIYNRQMFDELFASKLQEARRYKFDIYMILFDIDDFKLVNDNFGHEAGDRVLRGIALEISKRVRKDDIFARWGGEEFVLLLTRSSYDAAMLKAEELRSAIAALEFDGVGSVTCSFGVSMLKEPHNPELLFSHADEALYKAKHNGKNRVEFAL